jgi:hypothetical protein
MVEEGNATVLEVLESTLLAMIPLRRTQDMYEGAANQRPEFLRVNSADPINDGVHTSTPQGHGAPRGKQNWLFRRSHATSLSDLRRLKGTFYYRETIWLSSSCYSLNLNIHYGLCLMVYMVT